MLNPRKRSASNAERPLPERERQKVFNRLLVQNLKSCKRVSTQLGPGELHFKTIFIGESGSGKTQLVKRLLRAQFNPAALSTVNYDTHELLVQLDKHVVTLDVWDTAGQEKYRAMTPNFFRDSLICVVVYDICDRRSFEEARWWLEHYINEMEPKPPGAELVSRDGPNVALVGTKCDMEHLRCVDRMEAESLAESYNIGFVEMTALYGQGAGEFERILSDLARNALSSLQGHRRNSDPNVISVARHKKSFVPEKRATAGGLVVTNDHLRHDPASPDDDSCCA